MTTRTEIARLITTMLPVDMTQKEHLCYRQSETPFYLAGIFVERSPYKNSFYIRRLLFPMYIGRLPLAMTYSPRLVNVTAPRRTDLFAGSAETIVEAFHLSTYKTDLVKWLALPYGPKRFLAEEFIGTVSSMTVYRAYDLAGGAALCGDIELARSLYDRIISSARLTKARDASYNLADDNFILRVQECLTAVSEGTGRIAAVLSNYCAEMKLALKL